MRSLPSSCTLLVIGFVSASFFSRCVGRLPASAHDQTESSVIRSTPLILQDSEGEKRVHRPPPSGMSNLTAAFIMKVDRRNGGAPEFVSDSSFIPC